MVQPLATAAAEAALLPKPLLANTFLNFYVNPRGQPESLIIWFATTPAVFAQYC